MTVKVYAHFDGDGMPQFTLPINVHRPEDTQFGTLKQSFLEKYAQLNPNGRLASSEYCFWNQDHCPIADRCPVATFTWEHNDFFLRRLPLSSDASKLSAFNASQQQRGELSYYYAHNRGVQPLVSQAPAPVEERAPLSQRPAPAGAVKFNSKQSPFGTNINQYETITSYTWEDKDGDTVKVLVSVEGVGRLPPENVRAHFDVRAFELLVEGLDGKNLRFACYKTHGEMKPELCKCVVRANRVNLILRKAKEKDIWFDLFKKRAIGDDDDP